jgi:hypothetical protein
MGKQRSFRIAVSGVGIALVAAVALSAEDKVGEKSDLGRFRLGTGVSIVMPMGGSPKSGPGFGPFFEAEMKLTDRQSLRGKLEYVHFGGVGVDLGTSERWQRLGSLRLGADWVYSFDSDGIGPYVLGGACVVNDAWKTVQFDRSGDLYSSRHNNFNSLLVVGGGFKFKWFEVEYIRSFDFAGRPAGEEWSIRPVRGTRN